MTQLPRKKIFWYKPLLLLSSIYWPFSLGKILKKSLQRIQSYKDAPFLGPKWSICPKQNFLENYWYHSHLPISPFHCARFLKNSSSRSRVMRMCNFWAQNGPFPQMRIFFRKPINGPCFFHSCLSTCQKSKSNINLIVKRWRLKSTEISLTESHFWQ